jgi:hypothetical protein
MSLSLSDNLVPVLVPSDVLVRKIFALIEKVEVWEKNFFNATQVQPFFPKPSRRALYMDPLHRSERVENDPASVVYLAIVNKKSARRAPPRNLNNSTTTIAVTEASTPT